MEFVKSAPDIKAAPPPDLPEIAFAGRSNAGKSSVLNRLTGNRRTAKVSRTPGRTQLLNFFSVVHKGTNIGRVVDLPGYGFAKANRASQATWQAAVNDYLSKRDSLAATVLVMDIRHPLQPFDLELIEWAAASALPMRILLNKADKLKRGAQQKVLFSVRKEVSKHSLISVQTFSALRGEGQPELLASLWQWLHSAASEPAATGPDNDLEDAAQKDS